MRMSREQVERLLYQMENLVIMLEEVRRLHAAKMLQEVIWQIDHDLEGCDLEEV